MCTVKGLVIQKKNVSIKGKKTQAKKLIAKLVNL